MTSHERLLAQMVERAITSIESWLRPSMGEQAITLNESITLWLAETTAGPRTRREVVAHFKALGY